MDPRDIAIRLGIALLIGAIIGFERQWRQRMAGLRTNALVSLGAAGFVVFSTSVSGDDSPTRVAAQIVSGIGFLGAGVILREGINIRGLNTAATLWCSAMVGTFAGRPIGRQCNRRRLCFRHQPIPAADRASHQSPATRGGRS